MSKRRKSEDENYSKDDDIYFLMRKWLNKNKNTIDFSFVDKFEVKNRFANSKEFKVAKTYFTWDPKNKFNKLEEMKIGKVILKHNNGSALYKIVNSDEITEDLLKKLWKKWYINGKYFGSWSGELQYSKIKGKIICEEFIPNIKDLKIWDFDDKFIYEIGVLNKEGDCVTYDWNFNQVHIYRNNAVFDRSLSAKEVEMFKMLANIVKKIRVDFHFFARYDFMVDDKGNIYLGEISLTPAGGLIFRDDRATKELRNKIVQLYKNYNKL